jgi:hypothetical protein
MNRNRCLRPIRRQACTLAWLTTALLATAASPAAVATPRIRPPHAPPGPPVAGSAPAPRHLPPPPPGWNKHPPLPGPAHVHAVAGSMTYWQVALITAGGAAAAQLAALAARMRNRQVGTKTPSPHTPTLSTSTGRPATGTARAARKPTSMRLSPPTDHDRELAPRSSGDLKPREYDQTRNIINSFWPNGNSTPAKAPR